MKLITAIVKPDRLDDVIQAVIDGGGDGLTVTEVRGFGQQYGHRGHVRPAQTRALVVAKLRIDAVVQDEAAEPVVDAIAKAVNTGSIGDGKIWVSPVESVLRVRTGDRDQDAL